MAIQTPKFTPATIAPLSVCSANLRFQGSPCAKTLLNLLKVFPHAPGQVREDRHRNTIFNAREL